MKIFGRENEQTRVEWLVKKLAEIPAGRRILDAGAGELRNRLLCTHLDYVSQDFCQYRGDGDGSALQTGRWDTSRIDIVCDIVAIPEPDASFDVVLCSEVLEHVPDPIATVRELARLLRPGGSMILTAPFCSLTHFAPYHFATGLSRYWYERHLGDLGLTILEARPNGGWPDYIAQEIWRLPWFGKTYGSRMFGAVALATGLPLMAMLRLMAWNDKGSSELLTFGWHVVARKEIELKGRDREDDLRSS
jgi:SAM-dependent methyltransferase